MLLTLLLTLSASGFSVAMTMSGGDECCGGSEGERVGDEGDEGDAPRPDGSGDESCPPFCHSCACAPLYHQPKAAVAHVVARELSFDSDFVAVSELPPGPHGPGVFHPPR